MGKRLSFPGPLAARLGRLLRHGTSRAHPSRRAFKMLTLLRRFLSGAPSLETRMTRRDVEVLAERAIQAAHISPTPTLISVHQIDGRIIWKASTVTIGSGWFVEIDDATGEVAQVRRWGIR
jgi:hypothetical protein